MDFLKLTIFLLLTTKIKSDVSSLQDHHQQNENLDPLLQQDTNDTQHEQNKRTLCHNKCQSQPTYVKRLVIKGGFGLRPSGLGYRYPKPKVQFKLRAPAVLRPGTLGGWKQFTPSKPAIVEVPAPNLRPVVDHVHHGNHIDVQPSLIHPHGIHPTVVSVAAPAPLPAVAPSIIAPQAFIPAPPPAPPVLFEVTRPHLGVLPLGAKFNVPPLVSHPHPHYHLQPHPQPALSIEYHGTRNFLPLHHHHVQPHQFIQPQLVPHQLATHDLHNHVLQPHEHGHHNYFLQALPHDHHNHFLQPHEHHTQFVQSLPHEHQPQFLQQLPHEHHQAQFLHQQLPHEHQAQFVQPHEHQAQFLQQLPHVHQAPFLQQQPQFVQPQSGQSLPHEHLPQSVQPQPLPHEHHQAQFLQLQTQQDHQAQFLQSQGYQSPYEHVDVPQYQLPLEGEENQLTSTNVIQPGQTDVQIPYHLPQHGNSVVGGWQPGNSAVGSWQPSNNGVSGWQPGEK